jgi:drug/metabolite transporter (DMT)-like permease
MGDTSRDRLALIALIGGALFVWTELLGRAENGTRSSLPRRSGARGARPQSSRPSGRRVGWVVASGLFFAADLICWHWSIAYTSVANATFLANLAPLVVTGVAWLMGERISRTFLVGMLLAMVGATLLVRASFDVGGDHLLGDALAMMTAVFYAGYILTVKSLRRTMGTAQLMLWSSTVSAAVLLGATLVAAESFFPTSPTGWLILFGLAWISQVAGQGLITYGLAQLPASFSALSLLVQPVAAALLAWMLLDESLLWWQVAGGCAVLAGIMLARRGSRVAAVPVREPAA